MHSLRSPYGIVVEREEKGWRWVCHSCPLVRMRRRSGLHRHYRFSARPFEKGAWDRCIAAANFHAYKHHIHRQ